MISSQESNSTRSTGKNPTRTTFRRADTRANENFKTAITTHVEQEDTPQPTEIKVIKIELVAFSQLWIFMKLSITKTLFNFNSLRIFPQKKYRRRSRLKSIKI